MPISEQLETPFAAPSPARLAARRSCRRRRARAGVGRPTVRLAGAGAGKLVLVADASGEAREELAELLGKLGCTVLQAANGRAALDITREARPDLVVLEAMLPMVQGFDVCRAIKGDPVLRPTRVVLTSGVHRGTRRRRRPAGLRRRRLPGEAAPPRRGHAGGQGPAARAGRRSGRRRAARRGGRGLAGRRGGAARAGSWRRPPCCCATPAPATSSPPRPTTTSATPWRGRGCSSRRPPPTPAPPSCAPTWTPRTSTWPRPGSSSASRRARARPGRGPSRPAPTRPRKKAMQQRLLTLLGL